MLFSLGLELTPIFLSFCIFFLLWKLVVKDEKARIIDQLPGPTSYPIVGNLLEMIEPRQEVLDNAIKRRQKFGPIFRLWLGSHPIVILTKPEHIEILLRDTKHSEKAFTYRYLQPWLGTGLLTSYGSKWQTHRKLITPTFHFKTLQGFIEIFQNNAVILAEKLAEKAKTGEEFNIFPYITLCALDIICETAMGTKILAQSESQNEYVKSVYSLSDLIQQRMSRIWLQPDFIFDNVKAGKEFKKHLNTVQGFTERVIKKRKEALKRRDSEKVEANEEEKKKLPFLDLLLESLNEDSSIQLTDEEIREEVDTFMFEGHDTTAAGINWTLYNLSHHPKYQEEIYQELSKIFADDENRSPTLSDLAEMKSLERAIKESLRLYPSVTVIGRKLEEDAKFDEYLVPKGTDILISIYLLHRDPNYYTDPSVFDPDRFLPEIVQNRHPYAYIPFSAGPRNCIGQKFALFEEKVVLSTLLRKYRFESMDTTAHHTKISNLILRPSSGTQVRISRREK